MTDQGQANRNETAGDRPTGCADKGTGGLAMRLLNKVADALALLRFSARLSLGWQAIVLCLAALLVLLAAAFGPTYWQLGGVTGSLNPWGKETERNIFRLLLLVESAFFIIVSMGLVSREREEKNLEVLLACARNYHVLVLIKFMPVCIFVGAVALALTSILWWLFGGFTLLKMLLVPYGLAATIGMLTVVMTTYIRNQYGAGIAAATLALLLATVWLDPWESFYGKPIRSIMRGAADPTFNRIVLAVGFGFLFDHAARRLRRVELWMKPSE